MRGVTRAAVAVVAVAASLNALAGCTGGDDDAPDQATEVPDATEELDSYLDVIFASEPGAPNPAAVRYEEVLAECMAEAGFEYVPDRAAGSEGWSVALGMEGPFPEAEDYGYGHSFEGPGGGRPQFWPEVWQSETYQVNEAYRVALSPEAQAAYGLAMDGDFSQYSPYWEQFMAGELEYDPSRAGCSGRASQEVYPDGAAGPAELEEVKEAVDGMWSRLQEDPRVRETLPAWSACMEDAGYDGMTEIIDAVNRLSALFDDWQNTYADATPGHTGVTDLDVVKEHIPDALRELQDAEIALAVADATCREESGYVAGYLEAENDIAQEILDTYRADLDTWVAWAQEQRAQ